MSIPEFDEQVERLRTALEEAGYKCTYRTKPDFDEWNEWWERKDGAFIYLEIQTPTINAYRSLGHPRWEPSQPHQANVLAFDQLIGAIRKGDE